jgi:chromosome segregation ATPase
LTGERDDRYLNLLNFSTTNFFFEGDQILLSPHYQIVNIFFVDVTESACALHDRNHLNTLNTRAMIQKLILGVVAVAFLGSCNVKENKDLKAKVDSLSMELNASQQVAAQLHDVSIMLDSIESSRVILREGVVESTNYNDYSARMKNLNNYIKETQSKLEEMETSLKKSKSSSAAYAATVKKLKAELETSTQQVAALQIEVEKYRAENQMLASTVVQKDSLLNNNAEVIKVKEQDIAALEVKVTDVSNNATMTKADLLYAQGQALETAAERTKLAPRKKKETQREALELYKQSYSLGKQEAKLKIEELEKEVS